jgi:hypothetical protein
MQLGAPAQESAQDLSQALLWPASAGKKLHAAFLVLLNAYTEDGLP